MKNFESLGLSPVLADSLARMKYDTPTPIQAKAIPIALKGRDVMGSAQTGTGKTAAYSIPLVESLLRSDEGCGIVLTPTRELGKQVMDIIKQLLGPKSYINTAFLIGGEHMGKQMTQLRRKPRLIVGTPGRVNDHLERGTLNLSDARFLVLDETDRMLDMGFSVQIDQILQYMPGERQTLMFSATLPENIIKLSHKYLVNPERVAVGSTRIPIDNIKQEVIRVSVETKYTALRQELDDRDGSVIIFVKTKRNTEKLAKKLAQEGYDAEAIHGDLKQNRRDRVIKAFRNQQYRILVATDVVSRGLDIPHIEHVVNYDLPQVAEDYIHRIGRTARAGKTGHAVCLLSPHDNGKWKEIERLMDPEKYPENDNRDSGRGAGRSSSRKNFGRGNAKKKSYGRDDRNDRKKPFNKSGDTHDRGGEKKSWNKSSDRNERGDEKKKSWSKPGDRTERNGEKKAWSKSGGKPKRDGEKRDWNTSGSKPKRDGEKRDWNTSSSKPKRDGEKRDWNTSSSKPKRDGEKRDWNTSSSKPKRDGEKRDWNTSSSKPKRDGEKRDWKKTGDNRTERSNSWKTSGDKPERNDTGDNGKPSWKKKPVSGNHKPTRSGDGDKPWKKPSGNRPNRGGSAGGNKRFSGEGKRRHSS